VDTTTVARHSVNGQKDSDGLVAADTFISSSENATTNVFQLKLRLFSVDAIATPIVRNVAIAYSTPAPKTRSFYGQSSTLETIDQCS
jgi:hypothetical protein